MFPKEDKINLATWKKVEERLQDFYNLNILGKMPVDTESLEPFRARREKWLSEKQPFPLSCLGILW